jgi:phosphotriesterase-related protein
VKFVRTVCGDIAPADLGPTATHEHLYCDSRLCRPNMDFPASLYTPMTLRDDDLIAGELEAFREAGGRAIVEVTVHGWGRDVSVLRQLSERTGLHVVATAGFYIEECQPDFVAGASAEALAEFLVGELTEGADGTSIRPGLLKSAIGRPVIEGPEAKCARAVAQAHRRTGVAITTHTSAGVRFEVEGGNTGLPHLDLFEREGVDPSRVIVGHTDENADVRQLAELARRGAYVQFDVIGKTHWLLDETRIELLCRLAELGFGDHLLLSTDRARLSEMKANGGPGYDHLLRNFVPRLREAGFDEAGLDKILVQNPARALSIETE